VCLGRTRADLANLRFISDRRHSRAQGADFEHETALSRKRNHAALLIAAITPPVGGRVGESIALWV
jgi:hypothetical protein